MPDLGDMQKELAALRAARDAAAFDARALALRMESLKSRRAELARVARGDDNAESQAATVDREIATLQSALTEKRAGIVELRALVDRGAVHLADTPLDDRVAQLDDHPPFLLCPVRLETKFARTNEQLNLRVRIFPDDVLVSTHDPLLSQGERDSGLAYWAERARALGLSAGDRRAAEIGAWSQLALRYGGPRARYVARKTKPAEWPPTPGASATPSAEEPVRSSSGAAPPRARLLPDFFIVTVLDEHGIVVTQQAGRPIPDQLMLGPDPQAPTPELQRDANGRLVADPALAWLIDYDRAVDVGMAVTLPLPPQFARSRFRVIALGARLSLDAQAGAAAVGDLLSDHRFTDGIDLLRQGAPTNNTDGAESAFTTDLSADEALVAQEVDNFVAVGTLDHANKSDAQRLSEALGIVFEAVNDWPSAHDAYDVADALAMNRALWPATFGTILRDLVGQRMQPALKAEIERFFLTYVTGRGLLPNIRIGAQPYGVLATSDLTALAEPADPRGEAASSDMAAIVDGIKWYRGHFAAIDQSQTAIAQIGRGSNPLAMTMRVIGQLASSVSYASRKGVTDEAAWNTLLFENTIPLIMADWWNSRVRARAQSFADLNLSTDGLPLAQLVFFQDADPLQIPIVDRDPEVPLSETDRIAPFDGLRNYIDWLLSASTDELTRELFKNDKGDAIAPPAALLYRLLHNAWATQLSHSANGIFARLRPDLVAPLAFPSIVNVGTQKVLPDAHAAQIDAAKLDLTLNPRTLGDHLLDLAASGTAGALPEALPLQSQRDALKRLADRPTAVLERAFAEHIDVASYRLDAWQTGLVARRLDLMRRREGRARGVYVGAYGYVEDLIQKAAPKPVDQNTLPETLRGPDRITEQDDNAGFVHAPSLTHAVAAAVLRNGYLTHADPQNRDVMGVNLTSRRVRAAMGFVDGMRAGQDLAALLGYQFERGLHENYPGVELDEFIYILRARFPLVSRRLTPVPDGAAAEVIEARNVIDGYDLIDYVRTRTYPFGIDGLPTEQTKADAIIAEIARLEETLDAIADLLMAEGVHQAVQSNIDRARGVVGAIVDGEMPPVPDVVQTPRSGRLFTQRVALHLPAQGAGWMSSPTPRAQANKRLNAWLAAQLPAPNTSGIEVRMAGAAAQTTTLDQMRLDALDLVLMSGDRFGNGSSELERWLADRVRAARNVEDDVLTVFAGPVPGAGAKMIIVDASTASGATPLATLLPHLRALRRLIGATRGVHAQDYRLASERDKADPKNPKGFKLDAAGDLDVLPISANSAYEALDAAANVLEMELDTVQPFYDAVRANAASFNASDWTTGLASVRAKLRTLVLFGAPEALPRSAAGVNISAALGMYEQGRAVLEGLGKRLSRAVQALAPLPAEPPLDDPSEEARRLAGRLDRRLDNLIDATRQALGQSFPLQPVFQFDTAARVEIEARLTDPIERDPLVLEAWLQSLARVRPRMADLALASAASLWTTGGEPHLAPVQIPLRAGDPWIGAAWTNPPAAGEVMSVMTIDAPAALNGDLEGLLIDDWTETVPTTKETTGIAFHFDRPNAAAPQALLLATPPNPDGRWRWEELRGVIVDTFARTRLRAIEPDLIAASPLFPILPMTMMSFTSGRSLASTFLVSDAANFVSPE